MKRSLFNSIITSGNAKVITQPILRDIVEPKEVVKKVKKEEPQIEVKMSGEPSLEDIQTEISASKKTRTKKTNDEA